MSRHHQGFFVLNSLPRAILFVFYFFLFFSFYIFICIFTFIHTTLSVQAVGPTHIFTTTPLTTPTTWTRANSPYVIRGSGWLQIIAPLTIEPGVVIKFWPNRGNGAVNGLEFSNGGNLIANGTDTDPIIFTSIYDDTVLGDTLNDGSSFIPLPGDWSSLKFNHDTSTLSHIIVRYGGNNHVSIGEVETKNNSQLVMSDSVISDSAESGLFVGEPSLSHFTNMTIQNNTESGVYATVTSTASDITDSVINGNGHNALTISSSNSLTFHNTTFSNNTPQTIEIKGNTIAHDTIWQYLPDLTYVYWSPGKITVTPNITLTIEPGVNVKMPNKSGLFVQGMLHADGTPTSPILFTSYRDSTVGGDTAYSGPTLGVAGDWGGIYFDRSNTQTSTLSNLTLRYGGIFADHFGGFTYAFTDRNLINVNNSAVKLDHVTLDQGFDTAITLTGNSSLDLTSSTIQNTPRGLDLSPALSPPTSSITITNNRFVSTSVFALRMNTNFTLDVRHNWWGDDTGPTTPTNPNGRGTSIFGPTRYDPWIGKPETWIPVILIPGILGTEMKKGTDTIWMDLGRLVGDVGDDFLDVLGMDSGGWPIDLDVLISDVVLKKSIAGFRAFDYFDGLIKELTSRGYQENTNLFVFPYDWRLDIIQNSELLHQKIQTVLSETGADHVDIVAHSMGGLVAKQYIVTHGEQRVNKLLFIGTPHLGAPDAAKTLLFGDSLGIQLVFSFLNPKEIKKIAKNMVSIYELLPSRSYVQRFGGYIYDLVDRAIPNFDSTRQWLVNHGQVNVGLLDRADQFHSSVLDTFATNHIDTYVISGCKTPTTKKIIRRNTGATEDEYYLELDAGDGTVPLQSADAVAAAMYHRFYLQKTVHSRMPSQDGVKQLIADIVSNTFATSTLPNNIVQSRDTCQLNGKIVSVHSPVDIHLTDQAGNHVGKNIDGDIEMNIDGAGYYDIGNNKFLFIPDDLASQSTVMLDAHATGTFQLRISDIVTGTVVGTEYYRNIPIVPDSAGRVALATSSTPAQVFMDFTGINEFNLIEPTAILNASAAADFVKPSTTAQIVGVPNVLGWYEGSVQLVLLANDDLSGVLKTEYRFIGEDIWNEYVAPLAFVDEGEKRVFFRSVDRAGNVEETHEEIIKIDRHAPEARLRFDAVQRNFVVDALDEGSTTTLTTNSTTTRINDAAGHSTEVMMYTQIVGNSGQAKFLGIRYNGGDFRNFRQNALYISWGVDRNNNFTVISENATDGQTQDRLLANYYPKQRQTLQRHMYQILPQLQRFVYGEQGIDITTNNGRLIYNF